MVWKMEEMKSESLGRTVGKVVWAKDLELKQQKSRVFPNVRFEELIHTKVGDLLHGYSWDYFPFQAGL